MIFGQFGMMEWGNDGILAMTFSQYSLIPSFQYSSFSIWLRPTAALDNTMRIVLWTAGGQRFAVPTKQVLEVIPVVEARPVPRAAEWILGLINHRGKLAPLVDMARLLGHEPREPRMSSRILVVCSERSDEAQSRTIGLLVETVYGSETVAFPEQRSGTPEDFLGPVALTESGTVQWIEIDRIPVPTPPSTGTVAHGTARPLD